jgi:hypothetical protein
MGATRNTQAPMPRGSTASIRNCKNLPEAIAPVNPTAMRTVIGSMLCRNNATLGRPGEAPTATRTRISCVRWEMESDAAP